MLYIVNSNYTIVNQIFNVHNFGNISIKKEDLRDFEFLNFTNVYSKDCMWNYNVYFWY